MNLLSVLVFCGDGTASPTSLGMFLVSPPALEMSLPISSSLTWQTTAPCSNTRMGTSGPGSEVAVPLLGADPAPQAPLRSGWAQEPCEGCSTLPSQEERDRGTSAKDRGAFFASEHPHSVDVRVTQPDSNGFVDAAQFTSYLRDFHYLLGNFDKNSIFPAHTHILLFSH